MEMTSDLQKTLDSFLSDLLATLVPLQGAYFATPVGESTHLGPSSLRAQYCQLPKTHSFLPQDGKEVFPEGNWDEIGFKLPDTMPLALRVDVYDGPQGKGYVLVGEVEIEGEVWSKAVNVGPEMERERSWAVQVKSEL